MLFEELGITLSPGVHDWSRWSATFNFFSLHRYSSLCRCVLCSLSVMERAMPIEAVTEKTALQIPTQPLESFDGLISSDSCKSLAVSMACWEVNVALIFVVLAGFIILVLFYCVLLLRHKLRLVQAGNALEYFSFYHMANYNLKQIHELPSLPSVNIDPPVEVPPCSPPPTVVPSDPVIPALLPAPPPLSSRPPSVVPLPHPIIYTTPPSPQSDAEVYSRIGTLRPFRHSSVSQTQVVLFEHSSLWPLGEELCPLSLTSQHLL